MKQQTALNWMMENLPPSATIKTSEIVEYYKIKQKAKEMEKQQILDAIVQYLIKHKGVNSEQSILKAVEEAEQYYKETYE